MKRRYGYGWGSSSESGSEEEREPPEIETGRKNLTNGVQSHYSKRSMMLQNGQHAHDSIVEEYTPGVKKGTKIASTDFKMK